MNLVERVKGILLKPKDEWENVRTEATTVQELFMQYAVILAAIPAISGLIGKTVFGMSIGFNSIHIPFGTSIGWAVVSYLFSLVGVYIVGYIIDALAPSFDCSKDLVQSMKVPVYAMTASWVGGIFTIFPPLSFLSFLAGIYSLVLMYIGLKSVKQVPQEKMLGYFVVVILITIVVYIVIGAITSAVFFRSYMMP